MKSNKIDIRVVIFGEIDRINSVSFTSISPIASTRDTKNNEMKMIDLPVEEGILFTKAQMYVRQYLTILNNKNKELNKTKETKKENNRQKIYLNIFINGEMDENNEVHFNKISTVPSTRDIFDDKAELVDLPIAENVLYKNVHEYLGRCIEIFINRKLNEIKEAKEEKENGGRKVIPFPIGRDN